MPTYPTGCVVPKDLANRARLSHARHGARLKALPRATEPAYDLRALGLVPPVKDQGQCGDCWNFGGIAAAEGATLLAGKGAADRINWSEQSVLDCGRNGGCSGDWPETALEQCKNSGVADEKDYPYRGGAGPCRRVPHPNTIRDYGYVGDEAHVPPVQAIKDALKAHGILAVAVAADSRFMNYHGGVFKGTPGLTADDINHAVNIVGWHDDASLPAGGYWIVRNQWGTAWGEAGYARMEYGANLIGFGAMWADNGPPAPRPVPPVPPVPPPPAPPKLGGVTLDLDAKTVTAPAGWTLKAAAGEVADAFEVDVPFLFPGLHPLAMARVRDVVDANPGVLTFDGRTVRGVRPRATGQRDWAGFFEALLKFLAGLAVIIGPFLKAEPTPGDAADVA